MRSQLNLVCLPPICENRQSYCHVGHPRHANRASPVISTSAPPIALPLPLSSRHVVLLRPPSSPDCSSASTRFRRCAASQRQQAGLRCRHSSSTIVVASRQTPVFHFSITHKRMRRNRGCGCRKRPNNTPPVSPKREPTKAQMFRFRDGSVGPASNSSKSCRRTE